MPHVLNENIQVVSSLRLDISLYILDNLSFKRMKPPQRPTAKQWQQATGNILLVENI